MKLNRSIIQFFLLLLVIPALSCNLPSNPGTPEVGVSGVELKQTMEAESSGLEPAAQNIPTQILPDNNSDPEISIPQSVTTPTLTPINTQPLQPTPTEYPMDLSNTFYYQARSGDTLIGLAGRFGVEPAQITSDQYIPLQEYIPQGQIFQITNVLQETSPADLLLPDCEVVYSPCASDFDLAGFISQAGGYLSRYTEMMDNGRTLDGVQIIQKVADELSVNPRLLLALLEYRAGWVYGDPSDADKIDHPIGFYVPDRSGLYQEIMIAATQLNLAYYGWRQGTFQLIKFSDGTTLRGNPTLNAGSLALQHLFGMLSRQESWLDTLYGTHSFLILYTEMFGDAWSREQAIGPIFPLGVSQPSFELPFLAGERWALTAGPHNAWNAGTPRAALDLSPVMPGEGVCAVSAAWVRASASGVVIRSADNAVILDLDGDGSEQTGWVLLYFHVAESGMISAGTRVELDAVLGHPSCEGGRATGKHVHLARKYNGEWIAADGPLPFLLSGWRAVADERNYHGTLVKGDQVVTSDPGGGRTSSIIR